MIRLENVSKFYPPDRWALKNISFEVKKGEFLIIAGKSGAGKTTLLKLISGEELPTEGKIFYQKREINSFSLKEKNLFKRKIGFIYQDYRLLENFTVLENLLWAVKILEKGDKVSEIEKVLKLVELKGKEQNFPFQLSEGEKQRIAIARALLKEPELILADEPTANLDSYLALEIARLLEKINALKVTVILATHNRELASFFKKRIIVLEKGKMVRDDKEGEFIF